MKNSDELKKDLLNLEPIFNTYQSCLNEIQAHGYRDFKELCEVLFAYEYLPFIQAIKNSEPHTLQFILTH
ncbi:hypothetical protein [Chryseobacterium taklimakanense]|uniref:Uncharacterized protein n=1 Tax=Chryseobacterium taklimakanense TaxID=536441 RepID=A0A3G8WML6_9FLAO|nr:hypothetical protein [Chryseobacterium taklimakanense]AZI21528.1 hypothetical protein EIH08_12515 [Chryseobacterium taklimakanense]